MAKIVGGVGCGEAKPTVGRATTSCNQLELRFEGPRGLRTGVGRLCRRSEPCKTTDFTSDTTEPRGKLKGPSGTSMSGQLSEPCNLGLFFSFFSIVLRLFLHGDYARSKGKL